MINWQQDVCGVTEEPPPNAEPGWGWLGTLREAARGENGRDAANELASTGLAERELVRALGACHRTNRAGLDAALLAIGGVRGLAKVADTVTRAAREEAERQEAAERANAIRRAKTAGSRLLGILGPSLRGYELSPELVAPAGYEIDPNGVRRISVDDETGEETIVPVAPRPFVIAGRCQNVADGSVNTVLAWPTNEGNWGPHTCSRLTTADARSLVPLANLDGPFTSNNAAECVGYIAAFEAENAKVLPSARVSATMGWIGTEDNLSFLWGRNQVRGDGVVCSGAVEELAPAKWKTGQVHLLPSDPNLRSAAAGFHAVGTLGGWVQTMRVAMTYPRVMLGVYAAMVPPMMRFVSSLPNFVVDYSGVTSQGKTTTLRAAASVWGCPDERGGGIIYSWDVTLVFAERIAALCDFLPVLLDDTKRARRREEVGRHVYNHASGIGRGRGSIHGVQGTTRSHGVLISTGEESITSFTNDGGTRARCLCLWGSPFGAVTDATVEDVRRINLGVAENYGHLGPLLVQNLAGDESNRVGLRGMYKAELERWSKLANGNAVASRSAQYVAALAVAEQLFCRLTGLDKPAVSAVNEAWTAVVAGSTEADRATDALRQVMSWATSQQGRFHGRLEAEGGETQAPSTGWLGSWVRGDGWKYLALLPTELRAFFERQKIDVDATLRTWDDRGWLMKDGRHLARKVMVGERKERCYAISREACELADGGDDV